jgi:hypothetical protein
VILFFFFSKLPGLSLLEVKKETPCYSTHFNSCIFVFFCVCAFTPPPFRVSLLFFCALVFKQSSCKRWPRHIQRVSLFCTAVTFEFLQTFLLPGASAFIPAPVRAACVCVCVAFFPTETTFVPILSSILLHRPTACNAAVFLTRTRSIIIPMNTERRVKI